MFSFKPTEHGRCLWVLETLRVQCFLLQMGYSVQENILCRLATSGWLRCGSCVRYWWGLSLCGVCVCAVTFPADRASGKSSGSLVVASSTVVVGGKVS